MNNQQILEKQKIQRFKNWQLCEPAKNYIDIEELIKTPSQQILEERKYDVFCFDYSLNSTGNPALWIYGNLADGTKLRIKLSGFTIYVNVEINYAIVNNEVEWHNRLKEVELENKKGFVKHLFEKHEFVKLKIFKGYNEDVHKYSHIRYTFNNFNDYDKFKEALFGVNVRYQSYLENPDTSARYNLELMKLAKARGLINPIFKMSEDDTTKNYICKLQREYKMSLSGWNTMHITSIRLIDGRIYGECSIGNMVAIENKEKPPLSILTWDIEMSTETGKFDSNALNPLNNIICIGCSYSARIDSRPIKFCITYLPCDDRNYKEQTEQNTDIIMVSDECEMLLEFAKVLHYLDPSLITGFNDFNFDWPFVNGKLRLFGIETEFKDIIAPRFIIETGQELFFHSVDIKINASDKKSGIFPYIPGSICVDTRITLIKSQKIEKKSLNEYLKANKLPLKIEIDFKDMNKCFREYVNGDNISYSDSNLMYKVMDYCAHDADCCRLLWLKRNILQERLELANLSFTPLGYAFNRADGIKVRNMVASYAGDEYFSMPMSTTSCDQRWAEMRLIEYYGKYPGAYVPAPEKGINIAPVVALDFASLYPSIIMAHNLSPENIVIDEEGSLIVNQLNDTIHVTVPFENELKSDKISGNVVEEEVNEGLYPTILRNLFNGRKEVKLQIESLEKIVQAYDILSKSAEIEPTSDQLSVVRSVENELGLTGQLVGNTICNIGKLLKIDDVKFEIALLDAKEFALKVYMNTFYGETGNSKSPFFDLIVAGGTTTYGRKYIMMVHKMVADADCEVVYGDTDSIYLRPRASHYEINRPKNIYDLIGQSLEIAKKIRDNINSVVGKETRNVLKMEFEEVLCPSLFMGKKKYCGVKHKSVIFIDKLEESDLLIKGIDFIKSEYPAVVKEAGYKLLLEIMEHFAKFNKTYEPAELYEIFKDKSREDNDEHIKAIILKSIDEFRYQLTEIEPEEYDLLATKKKIREGKKGGEMFLFNERFTPNKELGELSSILQSKDHNKIIEFTPEIDVTQLKGEIDVNELEELGIEIPQEGEILDIVYVKTFEGAKASEKMHLLEFAKAKELVLDLKEYENMLHTSAKRLLVCCCREELDEKSEIAAAKLIIKEHLNDSKEIKGGYAPNELVEEIQELREDVTRHAGKWEKDGLTLLKAFNQSEVPLQDKFNERIKELLQTIEEQNNPQLALAIWFIYNDQQINDIYNNVSLSLQDQLLDITEWACQCNQEEEERLEHIIECVANITAILKAMTKSKSISVASISKTLRQLYRRGEINKLDIDDFSIKDLFEIK